MTVRTIVALSLLLAAPVRSDDSTSRLHFPRNGFSIEPIEAPVRGAMQRPLVMTLPVVDGFAPNLNIDVQPYANSIDAYLMLTKQQLVAAGFTLVAEAIDGPRLSLEYTGTLKGRPLHWYAVAVSDAGRVFLATATVPEARWGELGPAMRKAVDSFRLEPPK